MLEAMEQVAYMNRKSCVGLWEMEGILPLKGHSGSLAPANLSHVGIQVSVAIICDGSRKA